MVCGTMEDIGWFTPDGKEMAEEDWEKGYAKSMGVFLNGDAIPDCDMRGERVVDESFYVLFNAHYEPITFTLPGLKRGGKWERAFSTAETQFGERGETIGAGDQILVEARSMMLLRSIDSKK
jgi:isoamylase